MGTKVFIFLGTFFLLVASFFVFSNLLPKANAYIPCDDNSQCTYLKTYHAGSYSGRACYTNVTYAGACIRHKCTYYRHTIAIGYTYCR